MIHARASIRKDNDDTYPEESNGIGGEGEVLSAREGEERELFCCSYAREKLVSKVTDPPSLKVGMCLPPETWCFLGSNKHHLKGGEIVSP